MAFLYSAMLCLQTYFSGIARKCSYLGYFKGKILFLLLSGCGGVLTSQQGSFASPGYPQPYHHNAQCSWEIKVSKGSRIQLVFIDIDLEVGAGCRSEYSFRAHSYTLKPPGYHVVWVGVEGEIKSPVMHSLQQIVHFA